MGHILVNKKKYSLLGFESEADFEQAVIENKEQLFGSQSIYIDVKKRVGYHQSNHKGIPDGYLIDFIDPKSPQLYFVENELSSHDIYRHITEQLARFSAIAISARPQIRNMLLEHIHKEKSLHKELEEKISNTHFHNVEELMIFITETNDIKVVVVIDEETSDLNLSLKIFRDPPDVVVLQRYSTNDDVVYFYEPMREEIEDFVLPSPKKKGGGKEIQFDTVVCAAFEDGFKHAYIENSAWWAIRLSHEAREHLKYLAIYEKSPIGEIKHIAEIDKIEPYKDTGKYILYLKDKKKIAPIKLDSPPKRGVAPQGPRYTTYEKVMSVKKLSDLWKEQGYK